MKTQRDNYTLLLHKLDQFVKKYYKNKAIRGAIYFASLLLAMYLFISLLEYLVSFPPVGRKILIGLFLATGLGSLGYWVLYPLAKYFNIGRRMNKEQAAKIIGQHFTDVQDKLLNILQLHDQSVSAEDKSLIEASVNQKIDRIQPVPFLKAINISANRKYLKYAAVPLSIILIILISAPNVLRDSNDRLIRSNIDFSKQAPFAFHIKNADDLSVVQFADKKVEVEVKGEKLPEKVNALTSDYTYKLNKKDANTFTYTFKKVQKDLTFQLSANGYDSKAYTIDVLPKPSLINFDLDLDYPAYTGQKDEKKSNIGDLVVPEGTKISWFFNTENTSDITMQFSKDTTIKARQRDENMFVHSRNVYDDAFYKIFTSNQYIQKADSIGYGITVIPDKYPSISVEEIRDSTNNKLVYFVGEASDDYGLTKVDFKYRVLKEGGNNQDKAYKTRSVSSGISDSKTDFDLTWNLNELNLQPGDRLSYHFIVWDNDQVNGRKYTKTTEMAYRMPTKAEMEKQTEQRSKEIENEMDKTLEEVQNIQKQIESLKKRMLQKKELSWEDKKAFEDLLKKQKELQEKMDKLKKDFEKNNKQQSQHQEQNQELKEKEQQLQKQFDELMDEESKKLMEKIDELMKDLGKEQSIQKLENFEMNNEQFEKNLEQLKEKYKELEFEKKLNETQQELDKLAKEQEELSEKSKQENANSEELKKEQEELNKKFEDVQKDMDELEEKNKKLEQPKDMKDFSEQEESIKKDMEQSKENLGEKQNKKASQKQKSASDKMKQMSQQMQQMQSSMQMKQLQIDIQATKQLLENLLKLSFDQESLMDEFKEIKTSSPKYKDLIEEQNNLEGDFKMIEDSLHALSKRVFQIGSFVNKEVAEVKENMDRSVSYFAERQKNNGISRQQYVMTGLNNLALILDEILQSMQQQASSMMSGTQMCQQPSSTGQSFKKLRQQQQQLNDKIGKKKGGQKKGGEQKKSGKNGKSGLSSEEIAKMARQQRMLRNQLQELNEKYNKGGKKPYGNLEEVMEKMEKNEEDLVNKKLTNELMERLKDIEVRLLEAEKAEQKQERSNERKSESAEEMNKEVPPAIEEYIKKRKAEIDLYQTVPPTLNPFYKRIVNDYFKSITKFTP